jgi:hypothetical protein
VAEILAPPDDECVVLRPEPPIWALASSRSSIAGGVRIGDVELSARDPVDGLEASFATPSKTASSVFRWVVVRSDRWALGRSCMEDVGDAACD